jgi:hypothetical protein
MVLVALIVLLAEASARVPMACCCYDAAALAALTALLVEGSLALLAAGDEATAAPVMLVLRPGGLPAPSAMVL